MPLIQNLPAFVRQFLVWKAVAICQAYFLCSYISLQKRNVLLPVNETIENEVD